MSPRWLVLTALLLACTRSVGSPPGAAVNPRRLPFSQAVTAPAPAVACDWARGFAAHTVGGRGGRIVRVTTLANSGPGSLAEALMTPGPRVVVFEVGGVIDLALGTLKISEPFLTIAGQTAPSPGITLIRGGLSVATHDVVIQHLRVRPGTAAQKTGWQPDGISSSSGAYNFIVDHCSLSWAVDENLSASGSRFKGDTPDEWRQNTTHQVTFSHNIVAEGLAHATHEKGEHSKGSLIHDNVTGVLVYGNLYASNTERNPFFKGGARGVVANNFIVNPGKYAMKYTLVEDEWTGHSPEGGQMAVVGNVLKYGANTPAGTPLLFSSGVGPCDVFLQDNVALDARGQPVPLLGGMLQNFREQKEPPLWPPGFEAAAAHTVVETLTREVGARPWDRDVIDARIVEQALSGTSRIIDDESDVGGYPGPAPTSAPFITEAWDMQCVVTAGVDSPIENAEAASEQARPAGAPAVNATRKIPR